MLSVTLTVGVIVAGATPGSSTIPIARKGREGPRVRAAQLCRKGDFARETFSAPIRRLMFRDGKRDDAMYAILF
jgi:hypothetical protein